MDESLRYLKALVVLQAAVLEQLGGTPKPEVLLDRVGMGIKEIAELTGRSYDAVAQTLSRERRKRTAPAISSAKSRVVAPLKLPVDFPVPRSSARRTTTPRLDR